MFYIRKVLHKHYLLRFVLVTAFRNYKMDSDRESKEFSLYYPLYVFFPKETKIEIKNPAFHT